MISRRSPKKLGAQACVHSLGEAIVERQDVVAPDLDPKSVLQLAQLVRMGCGQIFGLTEILLDVVKFPAIVGEIRGALGHPREPSMATARGPSLVVESSIAEHLEVLRSAPALRVRVRSVERVGHADPLDRLLGHAVDHRRLGDSNDIEDGRHQVDHVVKLEALGASIRNPRRPSDDHSIARSAEVRGDLLHPLEGRVAGPGPTHREMRSRAR